MGALNIYPGQPQEWAPGTGGKDTGWWYQYLVLVHVQYIAVSTVATFHLLGR